jgi:3-hydroxyacyl-[acyl-carrier-protein] dehydratase
VDEVLELVPGERVVARKTVTEEDCAGHFPGNPIMPGVKMVEALAQCGAVAVLSQPENAGKLVLFAGIDDIRFKRIVRPGETLDLVCEVEAVRGPVGKGKVKASVGGELSVRGTLTFAVSGE